MHRSLVLASALLLTAPAGAAPAGSDAEVAHLRSESVGLHKEVTAFLKQHSGAVKMTTHSDDPVVMESAHLKLISAERDAWHAEQVKVMGIAQPLIVEATTGKPSAARKAALEGTVSSLTEWNRALTTRQTTMLRDEKVTDAKWLLGLLFKRRSLPVASQLAVLKRKEFSELPCSLAVLKATKDDSTAPVWVALYNELKAEGMEVEAPQHVKDHSAQGAKLEKAQAQLASLETEMEGAAAALSAQLTKTGHAVEGKNLLHQLQHLKSKGVHASGLSASVGELGSLSRSLKALAVEVHA